MKALAWVLVFNLLTIGIVFHKIDSVVPDVPPATVTELVELRPEARDEPGTRVRKDRRAESSPPVATASEPGPLAGYSPPTVVPPAECLDTLEHAAASHELTARTYALTPILAEAAMAWPPEYDVIRAVIAELHQIGAHARSISQQFSRALEAC